MGPLTRFYNKLKLCRTCFDKYVIEYCIAIEPPFSDTDDVSSYAGTCDLCKRFTLLLTVKYVTVLAKKRS